MKIAVRYYSKSGNTKKIANAIAKTAGVQAETIEKPLTEDVDILFLGSSVYAGGASKKVKNFISQIDTSVGEVVNFSTAAIIDSTYNQIKKLVENKGLTMSERNYHCRGSFMVMHKNRPNQEDIERAVAFTKKIVGQ